MPREVLKPPSDGLDFLNLFGYQQSVAIRANGLIFISGMLPIDPNTSERLHGTVTSETERIFENLKLVLDSAGSALDRIVQIHAYIYDRIEYDVLNRVYARYLPSLPPARTVWSVKIDSGFKVQIDAIACA
jgi:2-iminobutanoate/2-iminopropanoate deaminase